MKLEKSKKHLGTFKSTTTTPLPTKRAFLPILATTAAVKI